MDFQEMFKRFEFLFEDGNDVRKDLFLVEENLDIQNEKEKYAELALRYIEENVSQMAPITLLTNLGLLSLGESRQVIGLIKFIHRIHIILQPIFL